MLEIKQILNQLRRQITIVIFAILVALIILPAASVQADGYYKEKDHKANATQPYYSVKERRLTATEADRPYYSTKERRKERVIKTIPPTNDSYTERGRRQGEFTPRDLEDRR